VVLWFDQWLEEAKRNVNEAKVKSGSVQTRIVES